MEFPAQDIQAILFRDNRHANMYFVSIVYTPRRHLIWEINEHCILLMYVWNIVVVCVWRKYLHLTNKNGKSRETGNIHKVNTRKTNNYRQVKTSSISKTWHIMKTTGGKDELLYSLMLLIYSTCCHWLLFTDVITNDYKGTTYNGPPC